MDSKDQPGRSAPPTKYSVLVDDNSTSPGESRRYLLGEFSSYREAVAACQTIVDEFLRANLTPEISADELYAAYRAFGEDPFITPDNASRRFSAWDYARAQCALRCARQVRKGGSKTGGFTLIETLVTIGVISALTAILLPSINWIRQSASRIRCMSNMRQLATGMSRYTVENEGQLPYCNWDNNVDTSGQYGCGWLFSLPQFRTSGSWLALPHPPQDGIKTGVLWPYMPSADIYHCPIDSPDIWVGTEWMTSYLMNGAQCGYGRVGNGDNQPGLRIARIKDPCNSVMYWEAMEQRFEGQQLTGAVWNDGSSFPSEEVMADRHAKGANIACFDGHVEWWDRTTWAYWVNVPDFGRLWCDPLTPDGR